MMQVQAIYLLATVATPALLMAICLTTNARRTLKLTVPQPSMLSIGLLAPIALLPLTQELMHLLHPFFPDLPAGLPEYLETMTSASMPLWLPLLAFGLAPASLRGTGISRIHTDRHATVRSSLAPDRTLQHRLRRGAPDSATGLQRHTAGAGAGIAGGTEWQPVARRVVSFRVQQCSGSARAISRRTWRRCSIMASGTGLSASRNVGNWRACNPVRARAVDPVRNCRRRADPPADSWPSGDDRDPAPRAKFGPLCGSRGEGTGQNLNSASPDSRSGDDSAGCFFSTGRDSSESDRRQKQVTRCRCSRFIVDWTSPKHAYSIDPIAAAGENCGIPVSGAFIHCCIGRFVPCVRVLSWLDCSRSLPRFGF